MGRLLKVGTGTADAPHEAAKSAPRMHSAGLASESLPSAVPGHFFQMDGDHSFLQSPSQVAVTPCAGGARCGGPRRAVPGQRADELASALADMA